MQTGPLAEFLWASSIFHSGKMKISHPYNRLIGLKWHFIMLSIFLKTVMLRLAGSATEFWAGNKVLGSFTSLTQSLQQEGLYLLCKTQRSISHDFKGHIHLSAYLKACVPHRCCLLTFLHSHQLFISSLQLNWQSMKTKSTLINGPTTSVRQRFPKQKFQVWPIYLSDHCFQTAFSHYTFLKLKDAWTTVFFYI